MRRARTLLTGGALALALICAGPETHAADVPAGAAPPDVRILVDVSGSMKRSDPRNLRRSALALVVRLLPEGARAGVWTFGQYVNMQVALGEVTPAWRALGEEGAAAIHSRGLFTNIEDALARSTWDWTRPAPGARRHLILLTDGVVDVSKDPAESAASRARVIGEIAPRLAAAGVRVHTIALSEEVDRALLRLLAAETDGAHAVVESAAELQRVFLHMFERAAPVDALPLADNAFTVDESVREMTLLVFSAEDARPTRLQTPAGETLDATTTRDALAWRHEPGYDLVTVQRPATGEWRIDADVDPDNRVLIVTDLKLAWEPLRNNLAPGDSLELAATLSERGEPIEREDFLALLEARLVHWAAGSVPVPLEVRRRPGRPRFESGLAGPLAEGPHELVLTIEGGTFARQLRHVVDVVPPLSTRVRATGATPGPAYTVTVTPTEGLVDPGTVSVVAELAAPDGAARALVAASRPDGALVVETGPLGEPGEHTLALRVSARSPTGRAIETALAPITLAGPPPRRPEPAPSPPVEPVAEPAPAPGPQPEEPVEGIVVPDAAAPPSIAFVGAILAALNIVVGAGVWLALRVLRARTPNPTAALESAPAPGPADGQTGSPAASDPGDEGEATGAGTGESTEPDRVPDAA